ncbi:MAG: hypothetical protein AMXMBFR83_07370 [Phycisphaerae bacterium]
MFCALRSSRGWSILLATTAWAGVCAAQAPSTQPGAGGERARDPLATKQQIVRDRMTQLEDRMFRLTEKLAQSEPEQARKLEAAMKRSQELLIRRSMEDAIALLEAGKLTDASDRQAAAVKGLEGVLKILLEEPDNTRERQAEIDKLQAYQDQVRKLLENERMLRTQSEAAPRLARLLAGIQAAIAQIESLIEREQKQIEQTQEASKGRPADAGALNRAQKAIREETERLARQLRNPGGEADRPDESGQPAARNDASGDPARQQGAGRSPAERDPRGQGTERLPADAENARPEPGNNADRPSKPENETDPSKADTRPDAQPEQPSLPQGGNRQAVERPAGGQQRQSDGRQGDSPSPGGQQQGSQRQTDRQPAERQPGGQPGQDRQGQAEGQPGGQQKQDRQPSGERQQGGRQPGEQQQGRQDIQPQQGGDQQGGQPAQLNQGRDAGQRADSRRPSPSDEPQGEAGIEAGLREARNDVDQAGREMQAAENELGRENLPDALPMQKKSVESLRRALRELRRQEQATRRQLDQAEAARRQRDLEAETRRLADQMRDGQTPGEQNAPRQQQGGQQQGGRQPGGRQQQGGQQGGQQQQGRQQDGQRQNNQQPGNRQQNQRPEEPVPGNQNVERAGDNMQRAADELDRNRPEGATPEQQQAIEQLEQAQRELDQALDQLRREQQEEILRGLESRFRAMLAAQLIINERTLDLDKKGSDAWDHADELKLAALSQDQAGVADQAGQALHILKEEGTTVVFPRIVEQLREDMSGVSALLRDKKTGSRTQRTQADIVTTLKEMTEAIKELRRRIQNGEAGGNQGQGQGQGGGRGQNPPLLPGSAELKLLRSCQQRVARETSDFNAEREAGAALDADGRRQLERIAARQREIAEMARKMNERITGQ